MWIKVGVKMLGAIWGISVGVLGTYCAAVLACHGDAVLTGFLFVLAVLPAAIFGGVGGMKLASRFWEAIRPSAFTRYERRRKIWTGTQIFVMVPALFLALIFSPFNRINPPSDERMLAHFARNEAVFDKIVQRIPTNPNGVKNSAPSYKYTHPLGDEYTEPTAEYLQLLTQAGVPCVFRNSEQINFPRWQTLQGITCNKNIKGFVYLAKPPLSVLPTLNQCDQEYKKAYGRAYKAYRHIRGNWYLFYEYIPG